MQYRHTLTKDVGIYRKGFVRGMTLKLLTVLQYLRPANTFQLKRIGPDEVFQEK